MNSLPLSWSVVDDKNLESTSIINCQINWMAIKNLTSIDFNFLTNNLTKSKTDTLIRGCNKNHKIKLERKGYTSLHVGYEAILDLADNPFKKRSITDLIKRASRFGKAVSIPYSESSKKKLNHFQRVCSHGDEPQLKNLFQMEFNPSHLLNVFLDKNSNWQGAVLISKNSEIKLHTELLLRKKTAPIGVMETLIEFTFQQAKREGYKYFSLGEVPFSKSSESNKNFLGLLVFKLGGLLNFAYNYKGLYDFKNKFNPNWTEVYICVSNKVSFKHLIFLFINSNFHNLLFYKIFQKLLSKSPFFSYLEKKIFSQLDFNKT